MGDCRDVGHGETLRLIEGSIYWSDDEPDQGIERGYGDEETGHVVKLKSRLDCHPRLINDVVGFRRNHALDQAARDRKSNDDGSPLYSPNNIRHFEWLGSEAIVPLFMTLDDVPKSLLVLGHPDENHLSNDGPALQALRQLKSLLDTCYRLADLLTDCTDKAVRLTRLAQILPRLAAADSRLAFQRAVCTLLTCGEGFGFDRAMFFWMVGD